MASAGHANLDVHRTGVVSEPEIGAEVVLRQEASTGADLTYLFQAAATDGDLRTDRESIAGCRNKLHCHPMMLGRLTILEQRWRAIDVVHDDVEIAVIVEITNGQAAANPGELQATAGAIRNVAKSAAKVQQQLVLLTIRFAKLWILVDVRKNVTVGEEEIELRIEVGIEKGGSPSHANECGGGNARRRTGILETPAIEVVKQRVVIVRERREHQIHSAIAIVIRRVDAHPGLCATLAVEGYT